MSNRYWIDSLCNWNWHFTPCNWFLHKCKMWWTNWLLFFSATTCDSNCLKVHLSEQTLNFILKLYKPINLWVSCHSQYILQYSKQELFSTNALVVLKQLISCFSWQQHILLTSGRFSKAELCISIIKHHTVNTHEHVPRSCNPTSPFQYLNGFEVVRVANISLCQLKRSCDEHLNLTTSSKMGECPQNLERIIRLPLLEVVHPFQGIHWSTELLNPIFNIYWTRCTTKKALYKLQVAKPWSMQLFKLSTNPACSELVYIQAQWTSQMPCIQQENYCNMHAYLCQ